MDGTPLWTAQGVHIAHMSDTEDYDYQDDRIIVGNSRHLSD